MIDMDNNLCGFTLIEFLLFFRQALEAISEVGDLLQLKYSRREQPLPSLGWMAEESLLQDWATSSSPLSTPTPGYLLYLFIVPHFPLSQSLYPTMDSPQPESFTCLGKPAHQRHSSAVCSPWRVHFTPIAVEEPKSPPRLFWACLLLQSSSEPFSLS